MFLFQLDDFEGNSAVNLHIQAFPNDAMFLQEVTEVPTLTSKRSSVRFVTCTMDRTVELRLDVPRKKVGYKWFGINGLVISLVYSYKCYRGIPWG